MEKIIQKIIQLVKKNKTALLLSLLGFIFLFSFNFDWPFITGDDIAYLRYFEGESWLSSRWDMARPANQIFYESVHFFAENNSFWYYFVKDLFFFVFLFFFYKITELLMGKKQWAVLATLFVMFVYPIAFGYTWLSESRAFSTTFTVLCFWYFIQYYKNGENFSFKKKSWYTFFIIALFFVAASFNQTARFIPFILTLFLCFEWFVNKKSIRALLPFIIVVFFGFIMFVIIWVTFNVAVNYSLSFGIQPYLYFWSLIWWHAKYLFYLIVILSIINLLFYKNIFKGCIDLLQRDKNVSSIFLLVISWFLVTVGYSGLYGNLISESRYALPLFVPFTIVLFLIIFKLQENLTFSFLKKITIIIVLIIILSVAMFTVNTFLTFGNQNIAFNDARVYLNYIDTDAVIIYQSGTDDIWDYGSTNTFIRPGFYLQAILNTIEENKNKTIYLVEYPEPWLSTIGEVPDKEHIQTIAYWPIELQIYVYTGNKPFDSNKEYSYHPYTGVKPFYYIYIDEEKTEKIFSERIVLGKDRIVIVVHNYFLRTVLHPITKLKIKGRTIILLKEYSDINKQLK